MLSKTIKQLLVCLMVLSMSVSAFAQNHRVTGTIVDSQGPVIGATVMIAGTTIGASTDVDGKYVLDNVPSTATLNYSCIGYVSQNVKAGNQTVIDIVLVEDTEMIEETVVVGYGVQKKSDVTGSISQVKSEDMENRTISSADQALQGKTSGVVVMMGSAAPGSSPTIRVRGFSSNASSDPLYVVDGLRVSSRDISGIDPNTIESMEVLKDAASAAIYGAQAGNGVVLITTKSGKKGTAKVNYEYQHTLQTLAFMPEVTFAFDYITYYTEKSGSTFTDLLAANWDGKTDTDWVKESFETSHMNRHSVTFNGANDRGKFFLSGSYLQNDGILKGDKDSFNRLTFTFNGEYKFNDWMTVVSNVSMDRSKTLNAQQEGTLFGGFSSAVLMTDPLTPVYGLTPYMQSLLDQGWPLLGDENGYYATSEFFGSQNAHPLVALNTRDRETKSNMMRGNVSLNLTPFKGFTFTSRVGFRQMASMTRNVAHRYMYNTQKSNNYNTVTNTVSMMQYYQWENFANYNFKLGQNNFTVMAGMSFDETNMMPMSASVNAVMKEVDNYQYLDYQTASSTKTATGDDTFTRTLSYYGRLNWDYKGKYQAQASLRADAADLSRLSTPARWGIFPAASFGWVVSKENFMKNIDKKYLSNL
ncbi:MAG: SusC/RagA family TonB-linked outer membrane protein [Bacteroidales bacterium]|nr:SusC/RagA family TonB-linked outer membrane protein [Bacteroidales bacterium]